MKCTGTRTCKCLKCVRTSTPAQALTDGTYENATVVVRNGKVVGVRRGAAVFHSLGLDCAAPTADAAADPGIAPELHVTDSETVSVEGRGTSANPYRFVAVLKRDGGIVVTDEGLAAKQDGGASGAVAGLSVTRGHVTTLPQALITGVQSGSPELLHVNVDAETGVAAISLNETAAGVGRTRYVTYVRGTCAGPYPVWVDFVGGQYTVNIGYSAYSGAPASFPDLASAITAADGITQIADCGSGA